MENRSFAGVLPYLWYPLGFGAAIGGFALLLRLGQPPALAAYVPTVLVGLFILVLEFHFPEREEWRPLWSEVKADTAFLALVQILLPQALAAVSVIALADWLHGRGAVPGWPHDWPLWAQVAAVVLTVDFLRYWLHRACHHYMPLWKLHEVHHSPEILYVLNVGRFHPFEKTLHFALDTAPFLLLGVAPEVIAGYFLMYSVNGLFQHCNVRLRYGWLNYVVGSAETHRWHHARDPKDAACNFSNTTIVWDLVFGTWRLEREKQVEVGIMDTTYPQDFATQLAAPFKREYRVVRTPCSRWATEPLWRIAIWGWQRLNGGWTRTDLKNPMRVQRAVLRRILRTNRDTTFGREHEFAALHGTDGFAARVPVSDYETLRCHVQREVATGERVLTQEAPLCYVRTSGSTGDPKDLPLTKSHLRALRRIQGMSLLFQQRVCPEAFAGSMLGIVGAAEEGLMPNGRAFGAASGIVARSSPAMLRRKFVLPDAVFAIKESRLKYLLILRLALARRDVTYIGCANPTTLLALVRLYREHRAELLKDVRNGTFFLWDRLPPDVAQAVRSRLRPNTGRGDELEQLGGDGTRIGDLWPELRAVSTWTCGSAGVALSALRQELSPLTRVLELGYIASEFRGTITVGRRAEGGLPTFDTHFFEFVERDRWDRGAPEFLTLDRLRKGIPYYVIVTTPSGLYRYFINDLVIVCGFLHRTPLIKFLQKGRGVTSITGEKLYEAQVLEAVKSAMERLGCRARFFILLADETAARYRLFVEPDVKPAINAGELGATVDAELRARNLEYAAKRESDRLGSPVAAWLQPSTGERYKQACVDQGQRDGQFKAPALAYVREVKFDFGAMVESSP